MNELRQTQTINLIFLLYVTAEFDFIIFIREHLHICNMGDQKTGIFFQGVAVLLSSIVNNARNVNSRPNAEAKCQISCLSKNQSVHL